MLQEFVQNVEETARSVVDGIHTALPGKIVSFDPARCTAQVKPYGRYTPGNGTSLEYPVITEVPVVFPYSQAAGAGIVFPVRPGDGCLIVVSEVELDEWRSGAQSEGALRFDLTSAIAVPGLVRGGYGSVAKADSLGAVIISSGNTEVSVSRNSIAVRGNLVVDGNISCTGSISGG